MGLGNISNYINVSLLPIHPSWNASFVINQTLFSLYAYKVPGHKNSFIRINNLLIIFNAQTVHVYVYCLYVLLKCVIIIYILFNLFVF